MSDVVLDASALIAVIHREPGAERVAGQLRGSAISAANFSEVLKRLGERGGDVADAARQIGLMMVRVVPFDAAQAVRAATMWPAAKELGLSLGDRACLALGMTLGAEVLTADRRMAKVQLPVTVTLIRNGD